MRPVSGFMLVVSLLLGLLLMILSLALMARDAQREGQTRAYGQTLQALELAEAGLEDARVKLDKDPQLPLRGDRNQTKLCYTDTLADEPDSSYTVTIDWSHREPPEERIEITSTGRFETAIRTLVVQQDVAPRVHEWPNPNYFRMLLRKDRSSF